MIRILYTAVVAFTVAILVPVSGAEAGGWAADAKNGCKVWSDSPTAGETVQWSGACTNGLAWGAGVVQWRVGNHITSRFTGTLVDGRKYGRGRIEMNGTVEEHTYILGESTPQCFF